MLGDMCSRMHYTYAERESEKERGGGEPEAELCRTHRRGSRYPHL